MARSETSTTVRPEGCGWGKLKWIACSSTGNLDALDLVQLLDAALHLLGLGGLVAKAADEGFKMLDMLALILVGRGQLGSPLFLLRQVLLVVAVVNVQRLVPYLDGLVHRHVEKVAIVGDEDVAVGIVVEIALQPIAGFQIKVVGGLVEQQQAGLLQQQLGQRDAHLPAAGELLCLPRPVMLAEAQAAQHRAHLRVECIAVVGAKVGVEMRKAIGRRRVLGRCRVKLGQSRGKGFQFLLHAAQLGEDREALGKNAAAAQGETFLGQIADGHAARALQAAVVERFGAGEHLEQGRFPGTVGAHQGGALIGRNEPVGILEQDAGAEPFAGSRKLEHKKSSAKALLSLSHCKPSDQHLASFESIPATNPRGDSIPSSEP